MINGLIISHLSAEFRGDKVYVPLNSKEMQLALDHGPLQNESWELMCRSVRSVSYTHLTLPTKRIV